MYIRCLGCQASTWLEGLESVTASREVSCQNCGHGYKLKIPKDLGSTQREQYQRALGFAEKSDIDLPSAYSVLLGVMSLDEARGVRDATANVTADLAAKRAEASRAQGNERADRSSRSSTAIETTPSSNQRGGPAVESGPSPAWRTRDAEVGGEGPVLDEFEQRNRLLLAARLASKHDLDLKLAHQVVANRLSLHAALVERDTAKARSATRKPITSSQRLGVAVVVVLLVAAVVAYGLKTWTSLSEEGRSMAQLSAVATQKAAAEAELPAQPDAASPVAANGKDGPVVTDEKGRVIAVHGPDPQSVLRRFCEASKKTRLEPIELAPAIPPLPGSRLGVFRNFDRLDSAFAIRIRRDSRSRRWQAGDGVNPIVAIAVPEQSIGARPNMVDLR